MHIEVSSYSLKGSRNVYICDNTKQPQLFILHLSIPCTCCGGGKKKLIAFQPGLGRAPIHQAATQVVWAQSGLFKPAQTALLSAITTACTAVTRQNMKIKDLTGAGRGHPVVCSASLQPMDAIPSDASDELLCSPHAWMR